MRDFERIFREYNKPLELWVLKLCHDQTLAEDIAAEAMLRALMNIGSFSGRSSVFTWLCTIAHNLLMSEYRRRGRLSSLDGTVELPDTSSDACVADTVADRDTANRIALTLEALDEPMREVFKLHALGEVPLSEISKKYGKSESWARVVYYRAKAKIAERIDAVDEKQ